MNSLKKWSVNPFTRGFTIVVSFLLLISAADTSYPQEWIYTVRPGDNLWDLTEKYLTDMGYHHRLQTLNDVKFPKRLPPGQRLRFPVAWLKIQPAAVRVISTRGEAEATVATANTTIPVSKDLLLKAGDAVRTGPNATVTLEFADGSRFLIQSNSYLEMDTISAYGDTGMVDTRLRLPRGRLNGQIAPSKGPGTRFEIQTPAAISAVRGTDYRISMEPDTARSKTEVLGGKVRVTGANRSRTIREGFGTLIETGKPPTLPIRLLPPPDLSKIPLVFDRVPFGFTVPTLDKAVAYRLQIAPNRQFLTLLFDRTFATPQVSAANPRQDGEYVLRVRGIDEQGLEGEDAYLAFELDAFPEPPLLVKPEPDTVVRMPQPSFEWSKPTEAKQYHFQVAENATFDTPLVDLPTYSKVGFTVETDLAPGNYYWRIATIDKTDEKGPFSDPQRFTVKPAPASPELEDPEVDENTLTLRWRKGLPGQRYELQVAADMGFRTIILDERVAEPQIAISRPPSGLYYLRIRTIDDDGYKGPYASPQTISVPPQNYWVPATIFALLALMIIL